MPLNRKQHFPFLKFFVLVFEIAETKYFARKKSLISNFFFRKEYFDILLSVTFQLTLCLTGRFPSNLRKKKYFNSLW